MVSPEPPDDTRQVLGEHALLLGSAGQGKQLPGVILGTVGGGGQPVTGAHPHPTWPRKGSLQDGARAWVFPGSPGQGLPRPLERQAGVERRTYRSGGVGKVNLQIAHGFDNGHDGLDGVAVDDRPVLPALLL